MADFDYKQFAQAQADANEQLLKKLGVGGSPAGSSTGAALGGTGAIKQSEGIINGLLGAFDKLRRGSSATADSVSAVGAAFGKIPLAGGILQSALGTTAGVVSDSVNAYKASGAAFQGFNGDLIGFQRTIAKSGLTNEEFIRQQKGLGASITGMAGTTAEQMKVLTDFQNEFRKSPIGEKLNSLNLSYEQQAEIINRAMANSTQRDLRDSRQRQQAVDETGKLIESQIQLALKTNQSVDSISRKNALDDQNMIVNSLLISGTEETERAFRNVKAQLGDMGPALQNLAAEALTPEGPISDQARGTMEVLGPAGQEFVAATKALAAAQKEGVSKQEQLAAEQRMIQAKASVDAEMRTERFGLMVRRGAMAGDETGAAAQLQRDNQARLRADIAMERDMRRAGVEPTQANVQALRQEQLNRVLTQTDPSGQRSPGANVIQGVQAYDNKVQLEAQTAAFQGLYKLGKGLDAVGDRLIRIGGGSAGTPPNPGAIVDQRTRTTTPRDPGLPAVEGARELGTFGVIKENKEPKDAILKIHKGERVLNQVETDAYNKLEESTKGMIGSLNKSLSMPPPADIKMPFDTTQLSKMFGDVGTNVPMTKMFDGLKSQVSSMGADITATKSAKTDSIKEIQTDTANTATTTTEDPINTAILSALELLNKNIGGIAPLLAEGNNIAESMSGKIRSADRFA
jgi:hypothetical protein